ncbi:cell division protein FtsQ/DivIB [Candidatus Pelagibacter sp.]|nr:cell division protein FtsQ/DivIB [Candidatus Pelagibacter sp.]
MKSKRILIYFSLLIILGSINNISLNQLVIFDKIKNIKINGLSDSENYDLLKNIEKLNLKNIFFLNENEINKVIQSNTLVENFKIFKSYPSTLYIEIEKTNFLAKINNNNQIYIVGSNGKLTENNLSKKDLPFIFGNPNIQEFLDFKDSIDNSNILYEQINKIYFFKSKRWDIELDDNTVIKLPERNIQQALNQAHKFLNNTSIDVRIIDLRVKNQIIVNG